MPIYPVSSKTINSTYNKNRGNLTDSIWYGALLRKMESANGEDHLFREYSDEQKQALGICDVEVYDLADEIKMDISNRFMPEPSYDSYLDCMRELYRANNRYVLEEDDVYRQIYDSFPENEPYRAEKANYLWQMAYTRDRPVKDYIEDVQSQLTTRLTAPLEDIFDGKVPGVDPKKFTVGEALDKLGFPDAQKEAFIKKYGYDSLDTSFYDREIKEKPHKKDQKDYLVIADAKTYFRSCLAMTALDEVEKKSLEETSPDERRRFNDWKNRGSRFGKEEPQEVKDWIEEKGKALAMGLQKIHTASTVQKTRLLLEGDKSINDVSPNTDYKTALDRQAKDNAYIADVIQGKKQPAEVLDELIEEGREKLPGLERLSAEEYINEVRRGFKADAFEKQSEDYPAKQFADIFAARILSNSVRNNVKSLRKEFNRSDLNDMSKKLMDNELFRDFINETYIGDEDDGNRKLQDTVQKLHSRRTHGGFIEDEFKKYLLKRPAGELNNSPELAKFMPTAKERIEELKRQVKNDPTDENLQASAAAEIIAIRNACQVERKTGYGLDKQIPGAAQGKTIGAEVSKLTDNAACRRILQDEELRKDLLSGHGGAMTVKVRKQYEEQVRPENRDAGALSVLQKNTVGGRITELREEAKEINRQLESKNTLHRNSAMERSKEVLGEYMALVTKAKNGRGADAPWEYVGAMKNSTLKAPTAQQMLKTPEQVKGMMNAIASPDVGEFQKKFSAEYNAAQAVNAPKAPVKQQPGYDAERQGPHA